MAFFRHRSKFRLICKRLHRRTFAATSYYGFTYKSQWNFIIFSINSILCSMFLSSLESNRIAKCKIQLSQAQGKYKSEWNDWWRNCVEKVYEKNRWKVLRLMQSICENAIIIVHYGITSIAPISIAICTNALEWNAKQCGLCVCVCGWWKYIAMQKRQDENEQVRKK